jgi:hypothetical protein
MVLPYLNYTPPINEQAKDMDKQVIWNDLEGVAALGHHTSLTGRFVDLLDRMLMVANDVFPPKASFLEHVLARGVQRWCGVISATSTTTCLDCCCLAPGRR